MSVAFLVHQKYFCVQVLDPNMSAIVLAKYIRDQPQTITTSHPTICHTIPKYFLGNNCFQKADNGTRTRTGRAEVCHATPITSYPHTVLQYKKSAYGTYIYIFRCKMQVYLHTFLLYVQICMIKYIYFACYVKCMMCILCMVCL